MRWTLTAADRAALEQQLKQWWRENGAVAASINGNAIVGVVTWDLDAPLDAATLTRVLAGPRGLADVGHLQRIFSDLGVPFPGRLEVLDADTGQPISC